jgi:hypothetical protein
MTNGRIRRHRSAWRNFPDSKCLIDHPVCGDQHCRLQWCQDVQPDARHYKPGCEAGKATGETAEKCGEKKKSKNRAVHVALPSESNQRLDGRCRI